jgi:hypothetical protein
MADPTSDQHKTAVVAADEFSRIETWSMLGGGQGATLAAGPSD